ncbi:MAG TPA: hypothetical protein VGP15_11325 [Burkholderiales bacterium]|jgi:Ni/Co efflux regulator RcnB|nr:hypothetical protein [Burkholderiales bacterium]
MKCIVVMMIAGLFAAAPALADKPEWAGKGGKGHDNSEQRDHGEGHDRGRSDDGDRRGERGGRHFADRQRTVVYEYYGERYRSGHCPPGLAKKNNGCMPPGQAKKWRVGRPLPRDVVYYEVPRDLVVRIGPPPPGQKYVRVAGDLLLITVGTAMVVDAIQDLGRM